MSSFIWNKFGKRLSLIVKPHPFLCKLYHIKLECNCLLLYMVYKVVYWIGLDWNIYQRSIHRQPVANSPIAQHRICNFRDHWFQTFHDYNFMDCLQNLFNTEDKTKINSQPWKKVCTSAMFLPSLTWCPTTSTRSPSPSICTVHKYWFLWLHLVPPLPYSFNVNFFSIYFGIIKLSKRNPKYALVPLIDCNSQC